VNGNLKQHLPTSSRITSFEVAQQRLTCIKVNNNASNFQLMGTVVSVKVSTQRSFETEP
jgi:hypothetical protein